MSLSYMKPLGLYLAQHLDRQQANEADHQGQQKTQVNLQVGAPVHYCFSVIECCTRKLEHHPPKRPLQIETAHERYKIAQTRTRKLVYQIKPNFCIFKSFVYLICVRVFVESVV